MRFCFVTTFYPPYSFGGDGIAIQRLARGLVRQGHHVTVVHDADAYDALSSNHRLPEDPAQDGVETLTIRSGVGRLSPLLTHQTGRPFLTARKLRKILGEGRFDVINFHNVSLIGGPGIFAFGGKTPKIYTAHEHWLVCPTHALWRNNEERCEERTCIRCQIAYRRPPQLWRHGNLLNGSLEQIQVFIALSGFSRDKHYELGFPRKMEVLPQFAADTATPPEEYGSRPYERPYFLVAGRLERMKGVDEAIAAFARFGEADLLIAGEGTDERRLRAAASANPRCVFLGRIAEEHLRRYYRHAIATIVPSRGFETFGMVVVESFREGTPVIARRTGPFPEIMSASGGGVLFDTTDELVAALEQMQRDPVYARHLGERGHAAYMERWTESAVIPRYLELAALARERAG